MRIYLLLYLLILSAMGCSKRDNKPDIPYTRETGEAVEGIRIAWDYSSMQKLAPQGSRTLGWVGYPRIRKVNDGTIISVYETEGNGEMVQSKDNGKTWSEPVITFRKHLYTNDTGASTDVNIANTELCQLRNGDLVMACNYRPVKEEIAPFAIAIRRSSDKGLTWSPDLVVYEAAPRFADGCWEPSFLQLPDGQLQVYFANEAPFLTSDEQNISMVASNDNGKTWEKEVKTVCFRAGRRDGMPVALLVDDEILVSIEDNKIGQFKPYIVRTKISDNWSSPVLANSTDREYALKTPLPDNVYAGAPYLMRVPSGEVILSYQTTNGRSSNWELSTLEVAIGDKKGRNFEKITQPLDVPLDKEAKWNSVSIWDENTIAAAATTSFRNANCEVWMIKGHVIPELKIMPSMITVDGVVSVSEWGENFPLFIGHKSETNLSAAICYNEQHLYFCAKVNDKNLIADSSNPLKADGVNIYIDSANYKLLSPDAGIFKIWCNYKGEIKIFEGNKGQWNEIKSGNLLAKVKSDAGGYQLEIALPFSIIKKQNKSEFRVNLGLVEYTTATNFYKENITNSGSASSNTWMYVSFK